MLRQAQQDLEKQLTDALAWQKETEEELDRTRALLETQRSERAAEQDQAEQQLRQMHDELGRGLAKQHEEEHASLAELEQSKASAEELRARSQRLQSLVDKAQQELTARDAAEAEHRQRAEMLERVLESGDVGIFAFDRDCRFTFWNAAMERITGSERARVLGKLAFEVFPGLEESGESRHFLAALQGKRAEAQSSVLSQDGSRAELKQTYVPLPGESAEANGGAVFVRELVDHVQRNGKQEEEEHSEDVSELAGAATAVQDNGFALSLFRTDWDWLSFN